jgi:signal transduction histidine kinase
MSTSEESFIPDILIVDDVENNIFALKSLIGEHFDANIVEATSGEQVLRIILERNIDLILMDVMMPGLDGFETARLIRNRPKTSKIPIIFISAYDPTQRLYEKGIESGGFDYLTKPIDDHQLIYRLKMYLRFIRHEWEMNRHLRELNEQLVSANATKDKFFSIIAHDLKNPFQTIIGMTDMLLESFELFSREEHLAFIRNINQAGENTYKLLSNLLEWSKTQTGRIRIVPESFHIHAMISEVAEGIKSSADAKNIDIEISSGDSLAIYADRNMIMTVIRNLVQNGIKFTNPGGTVSVSVAIVDKMVEVVVADDGVGMNPEIVENLFRIEANVSTHGTAGEQGTGLGLILCREFVEKNGGSISVESVKGRGSRFRVVLPGGVESEE